MKKKGGGNGEVDPMAIKKQEQRAKRTDLLLAGDRVVCRQKGGGHLNKADASEEQGGSKTKHVANDAASKRNNDRVSRAVVREEVSNDVIKRGH